MTNIDDDILNKIIYEGFFSEYLPKNFNLEGIRDIWMQSPPKATRHDYIEPYKYTMSRYGKNDERRTIYIPEICSYYVTINFMKENNIFSKLINISQKSKQSFSKLIQENGDLYRHEQCYSFSSRTSKKKEIQHLTQENDSTFISNIIKKLNIAKGSKGVLSLDISNFFGSIYTHLIPTIVVEYKDAVKFYKNTFDKNESPEYSLYKEFSSFDEKVRSMNGKRTNGILTGPFICQMIAEALLSTIDIEISNYNINFTRYVDDYEIYIYNENDIEKTKNIILSVLNKYYLSLNNEKTEYTPFPYYKVKNLNHIIESYSNNLNSLSIMELFNTFFDLESSGTKGAVRYLVKSLNDQQLINNIEDNTIFSTYLLNILVNNPRSLSKVCELLIKENKIGELTIKDDAKTIIINLLISCIDSKKDLEVIWILYLIKSIGIDSLKSELVTKIINSKNDLAIILLLHEFKDSINEEQKNICISSAESWILLYELFYINYIEDTLFFKKAGIVHNKSFYKKLKSNNFTFYKPITLDEKDKSLNFR